MKENRSSSATVDRLPLSHGLGAVTPMVGTWNAVPSAACMQTEVDRKGQGRMESSRRPWVGGGMNTTDVMSNGAPRHPGGQSGGFGTRSRSGYF